MLEPVLFTHIPPDQRPWSGDDTDPIPRVMVPPIFADQPTMVGIPVVFMSSYPQPHRIDKRREWIILAIIILIVIGLFVTFGAIVITGLVRIAPTSPRPVTVTTSSVPSKVSN